MRVVAEDLRAGYDALQEDLQAVISEMDAAADGLPGLSVQPALGGPPRPRCRLQHAGAAIDAALSPHCLSGGAMLSPSPGPKYPCRETAPPQAGFTAGLGNDVRFDFATAVILPDGRVATSFQDRRHGDPKLAIELSGIVAEEAEPA